MFLDARVVAKGWYINVMLGPCARVPFPEMKTNPDSDIGDAVIVPT